MNDLVVEKKEKQSLNTGQQNKTNKVNKKGDGTFLGDPNVF